MDQRFYLGCAVWAYKDWIGDLFPAGSKAADLLALYSRRLTTVEGNTTFYATPKPEVVRRWAAETPESFRFCFKLPREISHEGPLAAQVETTRAFVERMAPLGGRLGPFFLQLPPAYRADAGIPGALILSLGRPTIGIFGRRTLAGIICWHSCAPL